MAVKHQTHAADSEDKKQDLTTTMHCQQETKLVCVCVVVVVDLTIRETLNGELGNTGGYDLLLLLGLPLLLGLKVFCCLLHDQLLKSTS